MTKSASNASLKTFFTHFVAGRKNPTRIQSFSKTYGVPNLPGWASAVYLIGQLIHRIFISKNILLVSRLSKWTEQKNDDHFELFA